jgi:hypothetical protein
MEGRNLDFLIDIGSANEEVLMEQVYDFICH